jgi:hypothetical protein
MDEKIQDLFDRLDVRIGDYDGDTFAIIWDWDTIHQTVVEVNDLKKEDLMKYGCKPEAVEDYWKNIKRYGDLRIGSNGKPPMYGGEPLYEVPEGLKDFEQILEEQGIDSWGFGDEYDLCYHCMSVIRTSPDCWTWTPEFHDFEDTGERVCLECIENSEEYQQRYIEDVKNQLKGCNLIDPEDVGFESIGEQFSVGMYEHSNDDPEKILERLNEQDIDVLFELSPGQFDTGFKVYVPEDQVDKAITVLNEESVKYPFGKSPADMMKKALKDADRKARELEGQPGITYSKMKSDGTADVRKVSEEEFVKGIKD